MKKVILLFIFFILASYSASAFDSNDLVLVIYYEGEDGRGDEAAVNLGDVEEIDFSETNLILLETGTISLEENSLDRENWEGLYMGVFACDLDIVGNIWHATTLNRTETMSPNSSIASFHAAAGSIYSQYSDSSSFFYKGEATDWLSYDTKMNSNSNAPGYYAGFNSKHQAYGEADLSDLVSTGYEDMYIYHYETITEPEYSWGLNRGSDENTDYTAVIRLIADGRVILNPDDITLELNSGWNLISFFHQPFSKGIETILKSIEGKYYSVWSYNQGNWMVFDPENPIFSDLDTLKQGTGYWVNMKEACFITIAGEEAPGSVDLQSGWNLVGFNTSETKPVSEAISSISDSLISVWSYEGGLWKVYDPSNPIFSDLNQMEPGSGYWMNMSSPSVWILP